MHQKKDWKRYSKSRNCLINEMTETAALIACGIEGGKAVAKVLKEMRLILYSLGALFITKGTFEEMEV